MFFKPWDAPSSGIKSIIKIEEIDFCVEQRFDFQYNLFLLDVFLNCIQSIPISMNVRTVNIACVGHLIFSVSYRVFQISCSAAIERSIALDSPG
jgi:hypothetical protein